MATFPPFTYAVPTALLPDAPLQAVHGADRPWCAAVAALACLKRGQPLLGMARKLTLAQQELALTSALKAHGIPEARQLLFHSAIRGIKNTCPDNRVFLDKTLSDYQVAAISRLTIGGGLLALAVGLGKTLTACVAARHFATWSEVHTRCWIICPLNAMPTWQRYVAELQKTFADVRIISIDSAHKLKGTDRLAGGVLIIDEVHNAGHMTARRTKALFDIRPGFDYCLGLTGTLLHAGIEPALTMLDVVLPGASAFASRWSAGDYFHCLVKKTLGPKTVTALEKPTGDNRDKFLRFMAQYAVLMTKESPEVRAEVIIPEQQLVTLEVGDPFGESIDDCIVRIAMAMINPETGELPDATAVVHAALREGAAEKMGWIMDNLDATNEPVVLFAEYHETLAIVRARLDEAKIPYAYVDGDVVDGQRAHAVERFQSGAVNVFVGQIDAAGASIDLFRGHISITLDHTQRATNYSQSLGRTCRRGQTHVCTHFDLIANRLQARCVDRLRLAEDFHMSLVEVRRAIDTGFALAQ